MSAEIAGSQKSTRPAYASVTPSAYTSLPPAMTSIGTGYDLSASTYSPDGRIFQVLSQLHTHNSYSKTSTRSSMQVKPSRTPGLSIHALTISTPILNNLTCRTAIGIKVKDGVVLAVEKLVQSKLLVPGANRRIHTIDRHIGMVRPLPISHMLHMLFNN